MTKVLDSFCRTCMVKVVGQTNQIIASYHIFQTDDFAHKFTQCTNLQVHPDDEYPSSVCENCLASVLSLYDFQIMCRDSIDKFSSMLVETKPEPEISCHLGNNNSSEFLNTMANQVVIKCEQYDLPELAVVVDPLLAPTSSQLAEIELQVQAGITELPETDDGATKKNMEKKGKSHEKGSHDEIHSNEDKDKFENSYDEEEFNTDSECASIDSKAKTSLGVPFQCDTCSKKFRFHHRFEAHMRRHQGLRGYPCTRQCERTFNRLSYLQQHLNDHDGIPRTIYKCEFKNCQQSYTCKSGLRLHKRKNHRGKPIKSEIHKCETCGNVYRTSRALRDHIHIHIDKSEWPFICNVEGCSKRFRKLQQLQAHQKRHTGEKPHVCDECGKKFRLPAQLKTHMRTHIKDAPRGYVCRICGHAFFTSQNLKHHEMKHTGEKPYKCDECDRTFGRSSNLRRHQRLLHKRDKQVTEATESDKRANSKDISKDE